MPYRDGLATIILLNYLPQSTLARSYTYRQTLSPASSVELLELNRKGVCSSVTQATCSQDECLLESSDENCGQGNAAYMMSSLHAVMPAFVLLAAGVAALWGRT
jgi:hypothetical protein